MKFLLQHAVIYGFFINREIVIIKLLIAPNDISSLFHVSNVNICGREFTYKVYADLYCHT